MEPIPEGEVKIPFSKFGTWQGLHGRTLNDLVQEDGGLLLIAEMAAWPKLNEVRPGLKPRLDKFLAVPRIAELLTLAKAQMAERKALTARPRGNHAERQRMMEYGM